MQHEDAYSWNCNVLITGNGTLCRRTNYNREATLTVEI